MACTFLDLYSNIQENTPERSYQIEEKRQINHNNDSKTSTVVTTNFDCRYKKNLEDKKLQSFEEAHRFFQQIQSNAFNSLPSQDSHSTIKRNHDSDGNK